MRGPASAPVLIEYGDFECPFCARLHSVMPEGVVRHVFRHFPVRAGHPRAWAAACAAQATGLQDRFWEMRDLLFGDQGRLEDPHLWEHARRLGLDLARFDHDRRSRRVSERVQRDFHSGVRAGVVTTPALFLDGHLHSGRAAVEIATRLGYPASGASRSRAEQARR